MSNEKKKELQVAALEKYPIKPVVQGRFDA